MDKISGYLGAFVILVVGALFVSFLLSWPVMTDKFIADKIAAGSSFAAAWEGLFGSFEYEAVMRGDAGVEITIDWEADGTSDVISAADIWRIIFDSNKPWTLSANGTIFTHEKKGSPA